MPIFRSGVSFQTRSSMGYPMKAKIGMKVSTKTEFIDCNCEGSHSKPRKFRSMS